MSDQGGMGVPPVWALVFDARPSLQTGETPVPPVFALFGDALCLIWCGESSNAKISGMGSPIIQAKRHLSLQARRLFDPIL